MNKKEARIKLNRIISDIEKMKPHLMIRIGAFKSKENRVTKF